MEFTAPELLPSYSHPHVSEDVSTGAHLAVEPEEVFEALDLESLLDFLIASAFYEVDFVRVANT
jgi:hypothetical protein